jgi:predicted naringenin-chalcone synthase
MSTIATTSRATVSQEDRDRARHRTAHLLGLGTSIGTMDYAQDHIESLASEIWGLRGEARERWGRIISGSGVRHRGLACRPEDSVRWSTARRMLAYEELAPTLAMNAAADAITRAGIQTADITDLIVVTCTGFSAPGVDSALVERLGLSPSVRRTLVGYMGCFGGIIGLRNAAMMCHAAPDACVLVVCVELCSLHFRDDPDPANQVATALFGDGAAAAIVHSTASDSGGESGDASSLGLLDYASSLLVGDSAEAMSWRITDEGFAMTLRPETPVLLRREIRRFVESAPGPSPASFALHPGGPAIIDAVEQGLGLSPDAGTDVSRGLLARHGNLSSGTVLFVLKEMIRRRMPQPIMLLAFGPGLSIESLTLHASDPPDVNGP